MPTPRTWLPRIDEILGILRSSKSETYDRAAIETLFEIQRRTALLLIQQVGPIERGTRYVVEREGLARWVEHIKATECQELADRQLVLAEVVEGMAQKDAMRTALASAGKSPANFPIVQEMLHSSISSLPSSIQIEPGLISVRFNDTTELLQLLYQLGLALTNDLATFERGQHRMQASRRTDVRRDVAVS